MLMLAVLLSTLPTVIIFFLLQRSFTEGIAGAVKG
jgi:lactose/L-arabinose transport system permease protein